VPEFSDRDIGVCSWKLTPKLTPDLTLIRRVSTGGDSDKIMADAVADAMAAALNGGETKVLPLRAAS